MDINSIIGIIFLGHRLRLNMVSDEYIPHIVDHIILNEYPVGYIILDPGSKLASEIQMKFPNVSILLSNEDKII